MRKHPYNHESAEYMKEQIEDFQKMRRYLDERRITPRSIIGTGYVGNTRKIAEKWIDQQIADWREALAEKEQEEQQTPKVQVTKDGPAYLLPGVDPAPCQRGDAEQLALM